MTVPLEAAVEKLQDYLIHGTLRAAATETSLVRGVLTAAIDAMPGAQNVLKKAMGL